MAAGLAMECSEAPLVDPEAAEESDPEFLQEGARSSNLRGLAWRGGLAVGLLAAVGCTALWASSGTMRSPAASDSLTTGLQGKYGGTSTFDQWLNTGTWEIKAPAARVVPIMGAPQLDLHDHNPCYDDEEPLNSLCYKKCSLLTADEYPHRGTPFSCCRANPCTFSNSKLNPRVCSGFDVSGDRAGSEACPHVPGACLLSEELLLGICYKKCSLLTNGEYPHRTSAATCCRAEGTLECLKFGNIKVSGGFATSGGYDDGDSRTPTGAHAPMAFLAESN